MASIGPKRKHSKARSRRRRAVNMRIALPSMIECPQCGSRMVLHRVCHACGHYRGRQVLKPDELA
ncbi:MAG: 50S ribosomal protein L32 [Spirochaetaceae bacterium]|nr:50S ribosomal protein L32 [Spirochaetaceae bacterium]